MEMFFFFPEEFTLAKLSYDVVKIEFNDFVVGSMILNA